MNDLGHSSTEHAEEPVIIPVEAYVSRDYLRAEVEKLWPRVWQVACREEELAKVGDYVTYDIGEESIVVARTAPDRIRAYYNVCLHRGRRLTQGCGHTAQFYCRFHGWRWNLDGENAFVLDREDWGEALTADNLRLQQAQVGLWGGWVWINMDPDCEPLADYLAPVAAQLDAYELPQMRYRWRKWLYFPCNWKTAMGAFIEGYHTTASHPQLTQLGRGGSQRFCSFALGRHSQQASAGARDAEAGSDRGLAAVRGRKDVDPRVAVAESLDVIWETLNATVTETFVKAAARLIDELPPGASMAEVGRHLMAAAKRDDAARGVVWPEIDPARLAATTSIWHLFPNLVVINNLTTALCYRVRPHGDDPDSCIFEVFVIERFPPGGEPKTEWVFEPDPSEAGWRLILAQDFQNMPEVQKGMKSRGFPGARPNPSQELPVINFNRNLAAYVGTGAPRPLQGGNAA